MKSGQAALERLRLELHRYTCRSNKEWLFCTVKESDTGSSCLKPTHVKSVNVILYVCSTLWDAMKQEKSLIGKDTDIEVPFVETVRLTD